ncbi:MAG: tRNA lysidine(34) synthetase TilS [Gammaproteobacteria bacterium]|nr:MAG: tRNA lysidine(34) synthetase TilS [Gammaproteobacteria bacterium]
MSQENQFSFQTKIKDILSEYPDAETCWIAYSGGLDSLVLLHVLASIQDKIKQKLLAVHINHGLSSDADLWVKHCQDKCADYAIELQTFSIDLSHKSDKGTEAFAREKRYEVLGNLMSSHDLLLTAHHMDDQVETILLQLMRGSGPDGLVGMPQARAFSKGILLRPLLDYSREEIHDYVLAESLSWIEDESNKSNKYDRNFLRNRIIPELLTRWPGALKTVQRAAKHQAEARCLINEISRSDLEVVCESDYRKLDISGFNNLSAIRKKNVLRAWIKQNQLETPNASIIEKIITEVIHANIDRNPCVKWKGGEIRRYREYLYIMESLPAHDVEMSNPWNLEETLELTSGYLKAISGKGNGIKKAMLSSDTVEIRYRQGGEQMKLSGRRETHDLKKLFQEHGVPPWTRGRMPLIYYENKLIAVADLWLESKYAASESEAAWQINWEWRDDQ